MNALIPRLTLISSSRLSDGATPMHVAAQAGSVGAIGVLLCAGVDPLLTFTYEPLSTCVALDVAARRGHPEVVRELIGQCAMEGCGGASGGVLALELAALEQHVDTLGMLTDAGVVDTGAALRSAAKLGREASVKFLLQQQGKATSRNRASVNSRDDHGVTALFYSIAFGLIRLPSPRIVRLLVDAGAEAIAAVRIADAAGKLVFRGTPVDLASSLTHQKGDTGAVGTAEELPHRLEGIRRLLLRVEPVYAAPLARILPLLRRWARRRGLPLATLFRHAQKKLYVVGVDRLAWCGERSLGAISLLLSEWSRVPSMWRHQHSQIVEERISLGERGC